MTSRRLVLAALALAAACRDRTPGPRPRPDAARRADALPPGPGAHAARPAPWCFTPLPHADVRAVDARGAVWSITGTRLTDETHGTSVELPPERPCPTPTAYALEFVRGGAAYALVRSRFYLRASERAAFVATPMCSDLGGSPWSARAEGGWAFVAHTWPSQPPSVLLTDRATGATGWYAITALDDRITSAVLDADHSLVTLGPRGRVVVVDQRQHVAGEILGAPGVDFQGLSRTAAGVVAFHDASPTRRTLAFTDSVQAPFTVVQGERPPGRQGAATTRAALRADLVRFVAVTDQGVELSTDRGAHFELVLATSHPLEHPTLAWTPEGRLSIASTDGIVVDHCLHRITTDQ